MSKHKPFFDGKLKGLWDSIKNSPYPLHYTLRWPLYFKKPSIKRRKKFTLSSDDWQSEKQSDNKQSVRIIFAGDIMILNGDIIPSLCPEMIDVINQADIFVANCEAPIVERELDRSARYTFKFSMPLKFLKGILSQTTLKNEQVVLSNANNHSGDMGNDAFLHSIELLKREGFTTLGLSDNNPCKMVNVNNYTIGFTGWTHWMNREVFDKSNAVLTDGQIRRFNFNKYKLEHAIDFNIGFPHWGFEFQHFPTQSNINDARSLIQHFDLIVGSHPHVLQPMMEIDKKFCFFSLGNFCGLGVAWPVKIITLLDVELAKDLQGDTFIKKYKYHYFFQQNQEKSVTISALNKQTDSVVEKVKKRLSLVTQNNEVEYE